MQFRLTWLNLGTRLKNHVFASVRKSDNVTKRSRFFYTNNILEGLKIYSNLPSLPEMQFFVPYCAITSLKSHQGWWGDIFTNIFSFSGLFWVQTWHISAVFQLSQPWNWWYFDVWWLQMFLWMSTPTFHLWLNAVEALWMVENGLGRDFSLKTQCWLEAQKLWYMFKTLSRPQTRAKFHVWWLKIFLWMWTPTLY